MPVFPDRSVSVRRHAKRFVTFICCVSSRAGQCFFGIPGATATPESSLCCSRAPDCSCKAAKLVGPTPRKRRQAERKGVALFVSTVAKGIPMRCRTPRRQSHHCDGDSLSHTTNYGRIGFRSPRSGYDPALGIKPTSARCNAYIYEHQTTPLVPQNAATPDP